MKAKKKIATFLAGLSLLFVGNLNGVGEAKEKINALYIPLADHYAAAIIAHAKYGPKMQKADYSVELMESWPALRGKFLSGQADVAFVISPLAMDMYTEKPSFHMVSLVHRDGNALAVNDIFAKRLNLAPKREDRKPTPDVAKAMADWKKEKGQPSLCGVPALQSTHVVVLYKYLKDNGLTLAIGEGAGDVMARAVPPPKSPEFIKNQAAAGLAASFEQSLPWADIVESGGFGKVAWYSKDVMKWPKGHVECIMIASDNAIKNKKEALAEVIQAIHQAGRDIDTARQQGGQSLKEIAQIVNKYLPAHSVDAVMQSLRYDLGVINYSNLNVDKEGLKYIMDLAVEGHVLKKAVDLNAFVDPDFSTKITVRD